jgi:hypothetical protein
MQNDAKVGLVVGLAVVIAISAVFYRKDGAPGSPLTDEVKAASLPSRKTGSEAPVSNPAQPVKARPAARNKKEPDGFMLPDNPAEEDAEGLPRQ